ncbi:MAG: hypothetical protein SP1CHLAM54_09000 [Chlamydiia bacterium]|nr:hypothetical protein [Chlamydiia bacterium]MCH9615806.1 hypothetical protein [Chlamydiia bacterium]MCH9628791.1 hypothetical protein [Chlamydiia bacterium]
MSAPAVVGGAPAPAPAPAPGAPTSATPPATGGVGSDPGSMSSAGGATPPASTNVWTTVTAFVSNVTSKISAAVQWVCYPVTALVNWVMSLCSRAPAAPTFAEQLAQLSASLTSETTPFNAVGILGKMAALRLTGSGDARPEAEVNQVKAALTAAWTSLYLPAEPTEPTEPGAEPTPPAPRQLSPVQAHIVGTHVAVHGGSAVDARTAIEENMATPAFAATLAAALPGFVQHHLDAATAAKEAGDTLAMLKAMQAACGVNDNEEMNGPYLGGTSVLADNTAFAAAIQPLFDADGLLAEALTNGGDAVTHETPRHALARACNDLVNVMPAEWIRYINEEFAADPAPDAGAKKDLMGEMVTDNETAFFEGVTMTREAAGEALASIWDGFAAEHGAEAGNIVAAAHAHYVGLDTDGAGTNPDAIDGANQAAWFRDMLVNAFSEAEVADGNQGNTYLALAQAAFA